MRFQAKRVSGLYCTLSPFASCVPGSTTSGLTICNRVQREGAVGTEGEAESEGPAGEGEVHHISGQVSTRRLEISAGNSSHKLLHS